MFDVEECGGSRPEAAMQRQTNKTTAYRWPRDGWKALAAALLLAASLPLAASARAQASLPLTSAGWRHRAVCAPFDYIPEVDRQRGGVAPGQRIVRLESRDGRRHYERVNTGGYVRLYRPLSGGSSREGRDWGYDRRGIWVDRGFGAEFVVGQPAVIAAPPPDIRRPPAWAIGTFRGRDDVRDATITVTIRPDGTVLHRTRYERDRRTVDQTGTYRDGRLIFDRARLDVERTGDGVRTTENGGRHSRVAYRRMD
jgi:hypothetical protein